MTTSQPKSRGERIAELTAAARRNPAAFRVHMRRLMWTGTLYVYGVLGFLGLMIGLALVSLPLGGGIGAMFLLWIGGGAAYFVFRSMRLWARPPGGLPLERSDAPGLFELIDRAREEVGRPMLSRVHLIEDFNAAVTLVRSRGIFGRKHTYLLVGLPLLHGLPADEFHAVIAHECAHLSDGQASDMMRMWRLQSVWQNVAVTMMQGDAFGGFLFRPFFRWFLPRFMDASVVFARELELDADHEGMVQTDRETAARLEIRLAVTGLRLHQKYGEALLSLLGEHETPPAGLTALKCKLAAEGVTAADRGLLTVALAQTTGWRDSHPALRDRLKTYDVDPQEVTLPAPFARSAAQELLGEGADRLAERLDEKMRPQIIGWWQHRHQHVSKDHEALHRIAHDERFGEIDDADRRERAILLARHRPAEAAFARRELEELVDPETEEDPEALHALGKLKVQAGDEVGVACLQRAAALKPELAAVTQQELGAYYAATGRPEEAEAALRASSDAAAAEAEMQVERHVVTERMSVAPHQLENHQLVVVRNALRSEEHVAEAWLARKVLSQATSRPVFVLMVRDCLDGRVFFLGRARAALFEDLNRRVTMGGDVLLVPLCEPVYGLWHRMQRIPGAQIYLKPGEEPYR